MPKTQRLGLALVLLIVTTGLSRAEDAAAWIEKMAARTTDGYYKVRINAEMNLEQGGMRSALNMNGTVNFATPERFRVTLDMAMDMGGQTMQINMLSVADGRHFWVDMNTPMTGKQVVKGDVGDLDKVAEMSGVGMGGIGSNPINEITGIIERFDMKVLPGAADTVVLQADVTPDTPGIADLGPFASSLKYIRLELDKKQAMPVKMVMGGVDPIVTMNFVDYEFFSADTAKDSDYAYTPPEGVTVNDVSKQIGQ